MIELEKETKEKENKMIVNKWKLKKDEEDMFEVPKALKQQQQKELGLMKKRRIIESPTQMPLPKSQTTPLRKQIPLTIMSCHH